MKVALELNAGIVRHAQQGDMVKSGILHFAGHISYTIFINKIVKVFLKRDVDDTAITQCGCISCFSANELKLRFRVLVKLASLTLLFLTQQVPFCLRPVEADDL